MSVGGAKRLPVTEHTGHPWRIHEIAPDFRVADVWAFRTPGAGPDDFPVMLAALQVASTRHKDPLVVRVLSLVRWKLGALLGWDELEQGVGGRVESLCDRLPSDMRRTVIREATPSSPFTAVYEVHDECANELANATVHTVTHLGWALADNGEYELRMAVLVKTNGLSGRLYMAAIKPFRYLIVYPAMTRIWERAWLDYIEATTKPRRSNGRRRAVTRSGAPSGPGGA